MPPKIQRYKTEPKNQKSFKLRASDKLASMPKKLIQSNQAYLKPQRKTIELNQISANQSPLILFDDLQFSLKSMAKRTSFIVTNVTKRLINKTNLSILDKKDIKYKGWVQNVEWDTMQGQRQYNQDKICIKDGNGSVNIYAVFDGHGGASASEFLKVNFVRSFQIFHEDNSVEDALKKSLFQLQAKILKSGTKINSGSCATILILKDNKYWTANIGDSRILLVRNLDEFTQLTEDHKPENPKEYKRIQALGGTVYRNMIVDQRTGDKIYGPYRVIPGKLSITRALGDFSIKKNQNEKIIIAEPDIQCGNVQPGDTLLIYSDGAYEQFSNEQISIFFCKKEQKNKKEVCIRSKGAILLPTLRHRLDNFMLAAKKRGTNDNTSLIAIEIKSEIQNQPTSASSGEEPSFFNIQVKL